MILNVVVGHPIVPYEEMLAIDKLDFEENEKDFTLFTEERFLPRILVEAGIAPSVSEVRRNRKDLVRTFEDNELDYLEIKWGKKRLFVLVVTKEERQEQLNG